MFIHVCDCWYTSDISVLICQSPIALSVSPRPTSLYLLTVLIELKLEPKTVPCNIHVNCCTVQIHLYTQLTHLYLYLPGDVMSPPNLDRLLVLPSGCGEQNLVRTATNWVVAEYLQTTEQLQDFTAVKIRNNIQTGKPAN